MITRAFRTLDCAQKVRVHYYLPRTLDEEFVRSLPSTQLDIQEFSKHVPGAKDHFRIANGRLWNAAGVLGENKLIITYGKFGGRDEDTEAVICGVHASLESLGCGLVNEEPVNAERRAASQA